MAENNMRQKLEKLLETIRNFVSDKKRLFGLLIILGIFYLLILAASAVSPLV